MIFGDGRSGKTNLLRLLAVQLATRTTADEALFFIVDYRRGLLDLLPEERLIAYAGSAPAVHAAVADLAAGFAARLPGPEVTSQQLRARSWWQGPEIYVLVDDYDLVAGANNPLTPLVDYLPQACDVGLHLIVARRSGGAARAIYEPVLQRVIELNTPGILLSGDRSEGALIGGVAPSQLPPGRGISIRRGYPPTLIQTAWLPPVE